MPFYISPIHQPSIQPQFASLEDGDLAVWLSVEEAAGHEAVLELWYEDGSKWAKADDLDTRLDLTKLRRLEKETKLDDNSVLVTLSTDPRSTFYFPKSPSSGSISVGGTAGVVERSKRETRMKKGTGLGALHQ